MRRDSPPANPLHYMSSPEPFEVTESFATLSIVTTDARPEAFRDLEEQVTPRQTRFPILPQPIEASSQRKRPCSRQNSQSVSDTEEEDTAKMPSGSSSSKHHSSSSSSKKHSSSSSSKYRSKSDDWSEVTEPEERRRIQNRIAQRKFREFDHPLHKFRPSAGLFFCLGSQIRPSKYVHTFVSQATG